MSLWLAGNWQEQLELGWEFVFGVESVGEIDSSYSTVSVDLHSEGLDIVSTVGSSGEIGQVELDLVPALIESHWHGANERFYAGCALIVGSSKSAAHVLVVKNLHFEGEVFLELHS